MTETGRLLNINAKSINARCDTCNYTLLQNTTRKGYSKIVKELLKHNADVNAQDRFGWTVLHTASFVQYEIMKELLKYHADANSKDCIGTTALMYGSSFGYHKVVKELLNHHADINIQNQDGFTALMLASKYKHTQIVMELINHKADVNLQSNKGNTALHSVLLENATDTTIDIVKLLLSDFTYSEKLNKENKSVLQLAKESHNQDIIDLIEDFPDKKKTEAAKREFKKLQVHQIIKKRKRKLLRLNTLNNEVLDLQQKLIRGRQGIQH